MTLIELLLALAMLSSLTVACVSWTTTNARTLATRGSSADWERAASASVTYLDELMRTTDRSLHGRERWRVAIEDRALSVRTRASVRLEGGGVSVCRVVRVFEEQGVLSVSYLDGDGRLLATRPLLGGVSSLDVQVREIDRRQVELVLRIVGVDDPHAERSWRLRREDLR